MGAVSWSHFRVMTHRCWPITERR